MKKISQYIETGKGRGLRLVFYVTLLLSIIFSVHLFFKGKQFINTPLISDFADKFPTFEIKDGEIKGDIKWTTHIPLTKNPITIDSTQDTLSLPVPDGIYLTRRNLYQITDNGVQILRFEFTSDVSVSPSWLHSTFLKAVILYAVGSGIFIFLSAWIGYFIILAFSALLALILGADFGDKRL